MHTHTYKHKVCDLATVFNPVPKERIGVFFEQHVVDIEGTMQIRRDCILPPRRLSHS